VPLADALSLLLPALDQQPWRFDTAAPRWHARLCAEARSTLAETQLAVSPLDVMAGPGAVGGSQALVSLCDVHGLEDAIGVLNAWLRARASGGTRRGFEGCPHSGRPWSEGAFPPSMRAKAVGSARDTTGVTED
jgi:hypothetical protein